MIKEKVPVQAQIASNKVKALRRFILAHTTFQQVIAACEFLIAHDSDENSQFYDPFFAGICVSYMRPFKEAERLGILPPKYSAFPDGEHARTHEDLKNGRNSVYAHYSPDEAAGFFKDEQRQREQKRIRFVIHKNGVKFIPPQVSWAKSRLPAIVSLCKFQIDRLEADIRDQIDRLTEGKKYEDGEYILGETFP